MLLLLCCNPPKPSDDDTHGRKEGGMEIDEREDVKTNKCKHRENNDMDIQYSCMQIN